jgi:hypothetical protein
LTNFHVNVSKTATTDTKSRALHGRHYDSMKWRMTIALMVLMPECHLSLRESTTLKKHLYEWLLNFQNGYIFYVITFTLFLVLLLILWRWYRIVPVYFWNCAKICKVLMRFVTNCEIWIILRRKSRVISESLLVFEDSVMDM